MGKISKAFEKSGQAQAQEQAGDTGAAVSSVKRTHGTAVTLTSSVNITSGLADMPEKAKWDPRLQMSTDPHLPYFENFRRLRTSILHSAPGRKRPRTVLVTSVAPHEGKGFVCASLGVAIAQDIEYRALMIDCDLRYPSLSPLFGVCGDTGLVDHLRDQVDLSLLLRKTGQPKLSLIPSGKPPVNPSEMLTSSRMNDFIKEMAERYDDRVVLFDSPPSIVASETGVLAQMVDGVVLVIRHGVSKKPDVKKLVESIGSEKILGLVYNAYPENMIDKVIDKQLGYGYEYGKYYS